MGKHKRIGTQPCQHCNLFLPHIAIFVTITVYGVGVLRPGLRLGRLEGLDHAPLGRLPAGESNVPRSEGGWGQRLRRPPLGCQRHTLEGGPTPQSSPPPPTQPHEGATSKPRGRGGATKTRRGGAPARECGALLRRQGHRNRGRSNRTVTVNCGHTNKYPSIHTRMLAKIFWIRL